MSRGTIGTLAAVRTSIDEEAVKSSRVMWSSNGVGGGPGGVPGGGGEVPPVARVGSGCVPTTMHGTALYWNSKYQQLVDSIRKSKQDQGCDPSLDDLRALHDHCRDFEALAKTIAQLIILESDIDDLFKTVVPVDIGGLAGGRKYIVHGILFKFATDVHGFYGGDSFAQKEAGHAMSSISSIVGHFAHADKSSAEKLSLPLIATIDFLGHRITAMPILPISGHDSLLHGSMDAGQTLNVSDPTVEELMEQIGQDLGLAKHCVCESETAIYGPIDLEVHRGTDGRLYCLDVARLMPCEAPSDADGSNLYRLLRPEFVRNHHVQTNEPLSSDAFSLFSSAIDREVHNDAVRRATQRLHDDVIAGFAHELQAELWNDLNVFSGVGTLFTKKDSREHPEHYEALTQRLHDALGALPQEMHRRGINMRHLGALERLVSGPAQHLIRCEILARCAKRSIRNAMRDVDHARHNSVPRSTQYTKSVVTQLNWLFCPPPPPRGRRTAKERYGPESGGEAEDGGGAGSASGNYYTRAMTPDDSKFKNIRV